jgi:hypothetical protein
VDLLQKGSVREVAGVTDKTIELDEHRGMMAQKATELRRLLAEVEADERALRVRQDELESHLVAAPALSWPDAAEKARYLLKILAATPVAQDPRRQTLIANVLDDFTRLASQPAPGTPSKREPEAHANVNDPQA